MKIKKSIIVIANQKGGVGKTTTAVNIAACWATQGYRVLLIDMDGQGNATRWLGLRAKVKSTGKTITKGLLNSRIYINDLALKTSINGLDVIGSDMDLTKFSKEKLAESNSSLRLERFIERSQNDYDIIVIDTHPSLDLLFQNSMNVAHYYAIPIKPEIDPLEGVDYMFDEIELIKEHNGNLHFLGLIVTDYDKKIRTHKVLLPEITKYTKSLKSKVLGVIPHSAAVSSSASRCELLIDRKDKDNLPVATSYLELSKTMLPELRGARRGVPQSNPKRGVMPDIFFSPVDEQSNNEPRA